MKNKRLFCAFLLVAVSAFLCGAWSVEDVYVELSQRYYRDANYRDWFGGYSSNAFWYFQGKMDARQEDAVLVLELQEKGNL